MFTLGSRTDHRPIDKFRILAGWLRGSPRDVTECVKRIFPGSLKAEEPDMAAGERQNRTLSLIIKTPNRDQEDRTVDPVPPDWTVQDLKRHLSAVYPSRPAVSEQRLIFAGKLLPDRLLVTDLFSQTDSVLSLHLVCPFRNPPGEPSRPKVGDAEQPGSSAAPPPSAPPPPPPSMASDTPELRQRMTPPSSSSSSSARRPVAGCAPPPPISPASFPTYSLYSRQQLLWLQQVYARQFYLQYHAALAAAGSAPQTHTTAAAAPHPPVPAHPVPVPVNQNPINNLPAANQNAVPDAAFVNPGAANQNLRMNAQGGPMVEDEGEVERDWLDWTYSAARLSVLLAIIYFNSNLSHFLLVMSTLLLMYLHTAGWFPFRRVQVQEPDQNQQNQQNQNQNQNQQNQQNQNQDGLRGDGLDGPAGPEGPEGPEGPGGLGGPGGPMTAVLVPPHRVSLMWTAWVFFKTFFSSLIPEVPRGVAN